MVESPDAVYCVHCRTKQPKDYKSGDLCVSCGKQAEPILSCYWCSSSGPGKFCRQCGAEFVATSELDLAIHLKREGLAKDEVPTKLRAMSVADKEALWGRIRKTRG
jgi:predicted amidophosphoribosyltransferase